MSIEGFLLINLAMDGSVLGIVARSLGVFRSWRVALCAGLSALFGLWAALHPLPPPALPLAWSALSALLSILLCGQADPRRWLASWLPLFCSALLTGGVVALLSTGHGGFHPLPALSGVVLLFLFLAARRHLRTNWLVDISCCCAGRVSRFNALIDTGNCLHEPISGQPVLIVEESMFRDVLPNMPCRAIGYDALSGGGTLLCYKPESVWINTLCGRRRAPEVWIALLPRRFPGLARALAPSEFVHCL